MYSVAWVQSLGSDPFSSASSRRHGLALPVDGEEAADDGHPDDADGGGHTDVEGAEVEGREEEAEGAALHGRLDGDRAANPLVIASNLRREVAEDAAEEVQGHAGALEREAGVLDRPGALRDRRANQQHRRDDADHRGVDAGGLAEARREGVQAYAREDRGEHDLEGGDDNAHGVDGHHGAKHELADERGHDDAAERGGGGHEDAQGHVAAGDEGAEVGRLAAVDGAHEHHAREDGALRADRLGQAVGEHRHDGVAREEVDGHRAGALQALLEVVNSRGDADAEHEQAKEAGEVGGLDPGEGGRDVDSRDGGNREPQSEEVAEDGGGLHEGGLLDDARLHITRAALHEAAAHARGEADERRDSNSSPRGGALAGARRLGEGRLCLERHRRGAGLGHAHHAAAVHAVAREDLVRRALREHAGGECLAGIAGAESHCPQCEHRGEDRAAGSLVLGHGCFSS
mmetsp:Transcript_62380/g.163741  ORF Transcript_62380/g.163741 Transcript_62380/m.163741 type:complete len:459 (+) Transcript_62380:73-1449(+)